MPRAHYYSFAFPPMTNEALRLVLLTSNHNALIHQGFLNNAESLTRGRRMVMTMAKQDKYYHDLNFQYGVSDLLLFFMELIFTSHFLHNTLIL